MPQVDSVKHATYQTSRFMYAFDCDGEREAIIAGTAYTSAGAVVSSYTISPPSAYSWEPVVPDSVGEAMLKIACKLAAAH